MSEVNDLKEWRAVEIVKLFLYQLSTDVLVEESHNEYYDLIVKLKQNPNIRFGIEVKSKLRFKSKLNRHVSMLVKMREQRLVTIPVFIIKVDDKIEYGEFDFLIFPSFKEGKLLIRETFKFKELNQEKFIKKIKTIKKWYRKIDADKNVDFESEVKRRTLTSEEIANKASEIFEESFNGTAIVASLTLTDPTVAKNKNGAINSSSSFYENIIRVKYYLDHAIANAKTIQVQDYDKNVVIEEVKYPYVHINGNVFHLIQPYFGKGNQSKLALILSVIITCFEIITVSIDNNILVKGSVICNDILFNSKHGFFINDNNSFKNDAGQYLYNVRLGDRIKTEIDSNLKNVNSTMYDYFFRFIRNNKKFGLILNLFIPLANSKYRKELSLDKLVQMRSSTNNKEEISRISALIEGIKSESFSKEDINIFKE